MDDPTATTTTTTDPRAALAGGLDELLRILDGVPAGAAAGPTPCVGIDVGTLIGHLHMVLQRIELAGRAVPPSAWPVDPVFVDEPDRRAWEREAVDAVVAAWADATALDRPTELPWGTFPGAAVLGVYTSEVVIHAWDLAVATGQPIEVPDAVVAVAFEALRAQMPAEGRRQILDAILEATPEAVEADLPFTLAADPGADPTPLDRLVAWSGRDPGWRP